MFDLDKDDVTGHYWKGLKAFASSFSEFEPVARHPGVGEKIAEHLLQLGVLETGDNPRYRGKRCYRLTPLGRQALTRGPRAKPAGKRRKIAMLKPQIAILEPRIKTLK